MKITLTLADPDDQVVVEVDGRDRRAGEVSLGRILGRPASTPWTDLLATAPETALAWQAWHACRRTGLDLGAVDWQTAAGRIVEIDVDVDEVEDNAGGLPDPTRPAPSAG